MIPQPEIRNDQTFTKNSFYFAGRKYQLETRLIFIHAVFIFLLVFLAYNLFNINQANNTIRIAADHTKSIMVQPIKNLSNDIQSQYIADGIMEDLLIYLNKIESLKIVSQNSAELAAEKNLSMHQIVRKIKVDYLLEGSVRCYNNNLKMTFQLINAKQDIQVWSQQFERKNEDLITVQREVAFKVVEELNEFMQVVER